MKMAHLEKRSTTTMIEPSPSTLGKAEIQSIDRLASQPMASLVWAKVQASHLLLCAPPCLACWRWHTRQVRTYTSSLIRG